MQNVALLTNRNALSGVKKQKSINILGWACYATMAGFIAAARWSTIGMFWRLLIVYKASISNAFRCCCWSTIARRTMKPQRLPERLGTRSVYQYFFKKRLISSFWHSLRLCERCHILAIVHERSTMTLVFTIMCEICLQSRLYRQNFVFIDLALLRLDKPVNFTENFRPVCMPTPGKSFAGQNVRAIHLVLSSSYIPIQWVDLSRQMIIIVIMISHFFLLFPCPSSMSCTKAVITGWGALKGILKHCVCQSINDA